MTVKDLIRQLKKMPQNAKVLVHTEELSGFRELGNFRRVELIKTMDGKGLGEEFGEVVVVLDEKPLLKGGLL
jgi:hypothetical protein